MKLNNLFKCLSLDIDSSLEIENLFVDSRQKVKNAVFFCIKGMNNDSHKFVDQAVENGAICIVHEKNVDKYKIKYKDLIFIEVDDSRLALSKISEKFYGSPSKDLDVYAITGTNGKTTIAYLIYKILSKFEKSAYNGTAGTIIGDKESPYTHLTTPNTLDLTKIFKKAFDENCKSIAFEVSSHALHMKRAHGIDVDVAIHTNLSRDHLDYHKTMEAYRDAKAELFRLINRNGISIINVDDAEANYFIDAAKGTKIFTYGKNKVADYRFDNIELKASGTKFNLYYGGDKHEIRTNVLSEINVYNLTAVIAALHQKGKKFNELIEACRDIDFSIGRFQCVSSDKFTVIVDYAHTPDGFEKIFAYTDTFRRVGSKVISVFGSAGKRDKGKRREMGEIASHHSDVMVLTEEDHRDESPQSIAEEIASGSETDARIIIETDREKAIMEACKKAEKGDLIVILGKGTEDFLDRGEKSCVWAGDHKIAKKYAEIYSKKLK